MRSAKRLSSAPVQSFLSAVGHADAVTLAPSRHGGCGGLESARTTVLTRVLSLLGSVLVTSSRLGPLRQPLVRAPVVTLENPPTQATSNAALGHVPTLAANHV